MRPVAQVCRLIVRRGFSLVEVLVALVVMSVGMLGVAVLHVQGLQAGRTSMLRGVAVALASDVADRIRANPSAVFAYGHTSAPAGTDRDCVAPASDCSAAELAASDIRSWQNAAAASLPGGTVAIVVAGGALPTYEITVSWQEPNTPANRPSSYSFTIPVLPR